MYHSHIVSTAVLNLVHVQILTYRCTRKESFMKEIFQLRIFKVVEVEAHACGSDSRSKPIEMTKMAMMLAATMAAVIINLP